MTEISAQLTSKQEKALAALVTEVTVEAAAKTAGVSAPTIYRWLREPKFKREVLAMRRLVVEEAIGLAQPACRRAVATLVSSMDCDNPNVQVRAAQLILETSLKGIETLELESRIEAVELALTVPLEMGE
jgi:transposase-like protein